MKPACDEPSELCRMPRGHVCWERCNQKSDEHYDPPVQPAKDVQVASREAAETIVTNVGNRADSLSLDAVEDVAAIIATALRKEREACARIAENHNHTHSSGYRCLQGQWIAAAIRESAKAQSFRKELKNG